MITNTITQIRDKTQKAKTKNKHQPTNNHKKKQQQQQQQKSRKIKK